MAARIRSEPSRHGGYSRGLSETNRDKIWFLLQISPRYGHEENVRVKVREGTRVTV